jgi:tRNA-dihydrouridine synthase A
LLAGFDARYYGEDPSFKSRKKILEEMIPYIDRQLLAKENDRGARMRLHDITRHMLGLMKNEPGSRRYRQILSDSKLLRSSGSSLLIEAINAMTNGIEPE